MMAMLTDNVGQYVLDLLSARPRSTVTPEVVTESPSTACSLCKLPSGSVECYDSHITIGNAGGIRCKLCPFSTMLGSTMVQHVRIHTSVGTLCCPRPRCLWRTSDRNLLHLHIESHHSGECDVYYLTFPPVAYHFQHCDT